MTARLFVLLAFVLVPAVHAANWPEWRGPKGNLHSTEKGLPLKFGAEENVRWKVALPGPSNSTPAIWGDRIFVSQAFDKKGHQRGLICFDRKNGDKIWEKTIEYKEVEPTYPNNYNAGSPITDGKRVVVCYGSAGVFCYDMDGDEQWRYDLGPIHQIWGNAISPVFYKNLAILWCGPGERQFLLALDLEKGTKVYQSDVPGGSFGKENKDWRGSWCTPTIARIGDRDEMIIGVPHEVRGYDPASGELLWFCKGAGPLFYTSPAVSDSGIVLAFFGFGGPGLAVKAGGNGDVTETHRLWLHKPRNPQRIGSPVIVGKHAYLVSEPGIAHCFEIETGKDLWDKARIDAKTWSSPVLVGDRFYLGTTDGDVIVFRADPAKFEVLERNNLGKGEIIRGTVAPSEGELFVRSYRHLWCISEKK